MNLLNMKWNFKCRMILIFDKMMQLRKRISHLSTSMLTSRLLQSNLLWNFQDEKDLQLCFPVLCLKCRRVDDGTV